MRIIYLFVVLLPLSIFSQFGNHAIKPASWGEDNLKSQMVSKEIAVSADDINQLLEKNNHGAYVSAIEVPVDFHFNDFSLVKVLSNGDKIYQIKLYSKNAQGMSFFIENLTLANESKLWVYDEAKTNFKGVYTSRDIDYSTVFSTSPALGETLIIEYLEPKNVLTEDFKISKAYHFFNSLKSGNGTNTGFKSSKYCEINAKCSEGQSFINELTSTCRILVYGSGYSGFCSGTLMNNTRQDHSPIILTANHCSANSTLSDLANWEFQFEYESTNCYTPSSEPTSVSFKGSTALAYTGSDGGETTSDFLLLKLKTAIPDHLGFNYMGWDRSGTLASRGLCFHHPAGDIKKVSSFSRALESGSYGGTTPGTHFVVNWARTTNGFGVTEGGSSGSGLLNSDGRLIGTLTGGTSDCGNNTLDMYGKLYYHWDKNGTSSSIRVKDWLDPDNTGTVVLKSTNATASIREKLDEKPFEIHIENQVLTIVWNEKPFTIQLYNTMGARIKDVEYSKNHQNIQIDLSVLPKGIYIVEGIQNDVRITKKIVY